MFQIAWKLIQSGYCRRMLLLADYRAVIQHAMSVFSPFSWDLFVLDQSSTTGENSRVHFGVTAHFLHPEVSPRFQVLPSDFYDLILLYNPYRTELQPSILEHFSQAIQVGFVEQLPGLKAVQHFGQPVYEYSMEDILKAEEISPPDGYTVVKLDEIADVRTGVTVKKSDEVEEAPYSEIYLITSRDLLPDGNVTLESTHKVKICALSKYFDSTGTLNEELLLRPGDILIASSGFVPKVAIISADLRDLATFASSLIRIRVDPNLADPQDVSTFLRSSTGRLSLFRFSSVSSTARRLSVRDIRQLLIFLPHKPSTLQKSDQLSSVSRAKRYITEEILPLLDERPSGELVGDLELVARKLNQFASTLVPPTLSEKVMNSYPTPIALTYRRFVGARFNVYEQVLRLKDLFEATSFFVYNLVLADALRRLDPQRYYIEERGARRAYNYYSMGQRMNYVAAILEVAKLNQGRDLFVPELVGSSFVDLANQLQDDLRNRLAHTATATESQQRRVLNEFQPIVEEMLDELQFLPDYRLVRVPSFYFEGGKIKRRMEVYQGAEPYLEEQEQAPGTDSVLIQADRDHLVFLDSEDQVLDLHPLYQLLASEETRYETHLCFFKQRRQQERRLEGESVQGAFPVELEGFGDFEALQTRIIDKRSGQ